MITPAEIASADVDRLRYLEEVLPLLWPSPVTVSVGAERPPGSPRNSFILVPHARHPRLILPAERTVGAAAATHYAKPGAGLAGIGARLLAGALRSGLGGAVLRDRLRVHTPPGAETAEARIRAALERDIRVSMHLGPPRANRKPVLQLITPRGETIGFAKIGVDELTCDLVRAERDTLRKLDHAGLTRVRPPAVVHHERWNGMEILVLAALPVWRSRRRLRPGQLSDAMVEIGRVRGVRRRTLQESPYWRTLKQRLTGVAGDDRAALDAALRTIAAHDPDLDFGAWHGDWAPWNTAALGDSVLLWDWERFDDDVPLGFDALHHWLQENVRARRGRGDPSSVASACTAEAPRLLAPFGVDAERAQVTALLYLADLATRYLLDGQQETGARLGTARSWLLPALTREVARLPHQRKGPLHG